VPNQMDRIAEAIPSAGEDCVAPEVDTTMGVVDVKEAVGKLRVKAVGGVRDGDVGVAVGCGPEEVTTIGAWAVTAVRYSAVTFVIGNTEAVVEVT